MENICNVPNIHRFVKWSLSEPNHDVKLSKEWKDSSDILILQNLLNGIND